MSAPFRELFVDASAAIVAALEGALQAKLAERRPHSRPSLAAQLIGALERPDINASLCEEFGFEQLIFERSAMQRAVDVIGVRGCRWREHEARASLPEEVIEDGRHTHDILMRTLQRMDRRPCYCVARGKPFDDGRPAPLDERKQRAIAVVNEHLRRGELFVRRGPPLATPPGSRPARRPGGRST